MMDNILNETEIKNIQICGKLLRDCLNQAEKHIQPGITTKELDQLIEDKIVKFGATPSFKNYQIGSKVFPATSCISVNDEVVHGIPSTQKILQKGDIVSIDIGAKYNGVCADTSKTFFVEEVSNEVKRLVRTTEECLFLGIKEARAGNRIGAIGHAIYQKAKSQGFGVVKDLVGHGIGKNPHMDPQIPNFGNVDDGPVIENGMALAIEPMITAGKSDVKILDDDWTIATKDGSISAHFEHTVVIINNKPVVVT